MKLSVETGWRIIVPHTFTAVVTTSWRLFALFVRMTSRAAYPSGLLSVFGHRQKARPGRGRSWRFLTRRLRINAAMWIFTVAFAEFQLAGRFPCSRTPVQRSCKTSRCLGVRNSIVRRRSFWSPAQRWASLLRKGGAARNGGRT